MDPDLVSRAQRGDTAAFAGITRAATPRLLQVAYPIVRDRGLAEEATQEALLEAWRTLPSPRDPARFEAWVYRILVRACSREARRQ